MSDFDPVVGLIPLLGLILLLGSILLLGLILLLCFDATVGRLLDWTFTAIDWIVSVHALQYAAE
jgi:hypothetical protein